MKKFAVLAVLAAAGAANAQTWDSGAVSFSILDSTSNQDFTFSPTVFGSTVTGFDIFMNPQHTWRSDLAIRLIDPAGHTTLLYNHEDSSSDFISCFFGGARPLSTAEDLNSAVTGFSYTPSAGNFSALVATAGTWHINADDTAGGDTGTISRIRLTTAPTPGSIAILGAGLGLVARRRRRA